MTSKPIKMERIDVTKEIKHSRETGETTLGKLEKMKDSHNNHSKFEIAFRGYDKRNSDERSSNFNYSKGLS
jgi:hypothetical protein